MPNIDINISTYKHCINQILNVKNKNSFKWYNMLKILRGGTSVFLVNYVSSILSFDGSTLNGKMEQRNENPI